MAVFWRIATDTPSYEAIDLLGAGAQKVGGRWNRVGTPMLYASGSIALAVLETFVHLDAGLPLPLNRYLVRLELADRLWRSRAVFDASTLVGWDAEPAGKVSLDWGNAWAKSGNSLAAQVPSVIVPEESNVLLNPRHTDINKVTASKLRRWTYDSRLGAQYG